MKEILEALVKIFPGYLRDLVALIAAPKAFIGNHSAVNDETIKNSLLFAAVSSTLGYLLTPKLLLPAGELLSNLGQRLVFSVTLLVLGAAAIFAAWCILGQRAPFLKFLITYIYYISPVVLILALFDAVGFGILYAYDPRGAESLVELSRSILFNPFGLPESEESLALSTGAPFIAMNVVMFLGAAMGWLWTILAWGAFRNMLGATRRQSFFAFLLAFMLLTLVGIAGMFIEKGLGLV